MKDFTVWLSARSLVRDQENLQLREGLNFPLDVWQGCQLFVLTVDSLPLTDTNQRIIRTLESWKQQQKKYSRRKVKDIEQSLWQRHDMRSCWKQIWLFYHKIVLIPLIQLSAYHVFVHCSPGCSYHICLYTRTPILAGKHVWPQTLCWQVINSIQLWRQGK